MSQTTSIKGTLVKIKETYLETHKTLKWVWQHILSETGRRYTVRSILALQVATLLSMGVTYAAKEVIDALANNERGYALFVTGMGIGGLFVASRLTLGLQEFFRELGWNDNYFSVTMNLSRMLFGRTAGEMTAENNEVGAEQIESAKDRIQNILYMVLFEGPMVVVGMLSATLLSFTVDPLAGLTLIGLISANVLWFLYCNSLIDDRMAEIDKGFRRAFRRMIEKWNFFLSTKTNGVENKVLDQIAHETQVPLLEDKRVWAYWFIPIDLLRGHFNIIVLVGVLAIGIHYRDWSSGDFAAIFFWFSMATDRFGYLGHLMRHLTSQVVRVRAVREALEKEPQFRHDVGIEYQPKERND